jgi:hypothetical protein
MLPHVIDIYLIQLVKVSRIYEIFKPTGNQAPSLHGQTTKYQKNEYFCVSKKSVYDRQKTSDNHLSCPCRSINLSSTGTP